MTNPVGRPTKYTKALAERICAKLIEGISLRTVCKAPDMPDAATVFRWLGLYKDFREQYARAKEESAEAMNEEIVELGDEAIRMSQSVDFKASNAVVQAYKLKADNLRWMMSKMKPKKYGDKLDMTTNGKDIPVPIYAGKSTKKRV